MSKGRTGAAAIGVVLFGIVANLAGIALVVWFVVWLLRVLGVLSS